ncbi:MAG TPA: ribosomal-processing cysteine protease Prp [Clostridia bacterium]|nr:ribosomal-processing cysteine protease Prp [Clostridia bacterium]
MITARFFLKNGAVAGFEVSGHAGMDAQGHDVACASVTSAVQMAANTVTEIIGAKAGIQVDEALIKMELADTNGAESEKAVQAVLKGMRLHLKLLTQEFQEFIRVEDMEVQSK